MSTSFTGPDGREYVWRYPSGFCVHGTFVNDPTFRTVCPSCEEEGYPSWPPFLPVLWDQSDERAQSDLFYKSQSSEEIESDDDEHFFDDQITWLIVLIGLAAGVLALIACFAQVL